jgi:hypothetical protein
MVTGPGAVQVVAEFESWTTQLSVESGRLFRRSRSVRCSFDPILSGLPDLLLGHSHEAHSILSNHRKESPVRTRKVATSLAIAGLVFAAPAGTAVAKHPPCGKYKAAHTNCGKHKAKGKHK